MRSRLFAPALVFAVALGIYLLTMPPGLTWAHDSGDGGDLITAAVVGGVAHPSGYPTYLLLASPLTRLPWHNPAWRVALLSALSAATAAALAAATVQSLLARSRESTIAALVAGLTLAFSLDFWGQATVAEVYALHACLAAALLWAILQWRRSDHPGWAAATGLLWGLALGNHLTSFWLFPLVLAALLTGRSRRRRGLAAAAVGLLAGLSVYLLLPWLARTNPPVNWGDPTTLGGFRWLVSGELYYGFVFGVPLSSLPGRFAASAGLVLRNFLPWGVALAAAGLLRWPQRYRWINAGMAASLLLGLLWAAAYDTSDSYLTWLSAWPFFAVWIGLGVAALARWLAETDRRGRLTMALAALVLIAVPLMWNWSVNDLSNDRAAEDFVAEVMQAVEPDALLVTLGDRATFALWYGRYADGQRHDITPISHDLWPLAWYRRNVAETHPELGGALEIASLDDLLRQATTSRPVYLIREGENESPPPDGNWQPLPAPTDPQGRPLWRLWRWDQRLP